ncbi:na+/h+ antiporter nhaa [Heliomicrobium modesticaldum Ice1]|uniref:Na(+)/H(+) antiporter NhaA n=1 Tax=Heliobacterium modesticaldum (strain ATCC 51547 / Ice1) TaxID=498761 RepID=B0TD75_HELMI|nr:Na+/H+ antiporter NhaA [Heliomicrobium modesticaldum]ABZ84116.1 na+/h+ antiporter nhaa [Heliomicrobium modesticaldum Ice1]
MREKALRFIKETIKRPVEAFIQTETSSSIILLVCTALALLIANSPWRPLYEAFFAQPFTIGLPGFGLSKAMILWINDGLMAIFFFVVGLEIKREILEGELSSLKKASLPIVAAIGGMVAPAVIYILFNLNLPSAGGWGIPMATDIAFALGALSLLGPQVPLALKILLIAIAIVDDLGAVLVIAFFYTETLQLSYLALAAVVGAALILLNTSGVRKITPYILLGLILWVAFLKSGIHATIAGVLLALTIPMRTIIDTEEFAERVEETIQGFHDQGKSGDTVVTEEVHSLIAQLNHLADRATSPLHRLEHALHPWVGFLIMPLFAFANAGVPLDDLSGLTTPVSLGILIGLIAGKQVGVTLFSWLAIRLGLASLPEGMTFIQLYGLSWLAGIGFTMSLFISGLAFPEAPELLNQAKVAILLASVAAGTAGFFLLKTFLPEAPSVKLHE